MNAQQINQAYNDGLITEGERHQLLEDNGCYARQYLRIHALIDEMRKAVNEVPSYVEQQARQFAAERQVK